ncbi:DUF3800 domain-containing protein [Tsukamurella tyrosinosolvens]|uniref:DUF3800 domain-containing protein n=1 Tax=Tsukamurella tyrosinosolvens TaxID=57704 RepID=UPI000C7F6F62|nr:DUF3800 domain-containing protein [Tsukamurella tyrosinosolvens]AUN38641.1 hypothetical protein ASU32_00295 [Tsukamurella tyrosinosolvens]
MATRHEIHQAFVDESYIAGGTFYFVGAAVGSEAQWDQVESALAEYRAECVSRWSLRPDAEFHAYDITSGAGDWKVLRGQHRAAVGVLDTILQIAWDADIQYIVRGVNAVGLRRRYKHPHPPHLVAFRHVLERINTFAVQNLLSQEVIVVADNHPDSHRWVETIDGYRQVGTGGYRSSDLRHISDPINFADSRMVAGLQVADIVTYLRRRIEEVPDPGKAEARARRRLVQKIRPRSQQTGVWHP